MSALGAFGLATCCQAPAASCVWEKPKITVMASGSAFEKPMKVPKVAMYSTVIDQVCLSRKMANCFSRFGFMSPKATSFMASSVTTMISGIAIHMLSRPSPVGAGRYRYRPTAEVRSATPYSSRMRPSAAAVEPMCGETVSRLFMPNQPMKASGTRSSSQTKPAFWMKVGVPASILPISVPEGFTSVIGSPPSAPNTAVVMTSGMRICIVVTPKLPRPALMPSARPCWRFGKKVLMFDIEQAKLPPPIPESSAISWKTQSGVALSCSAMPVPIAGIMSSAVVRKIVLRPPAMRMKKEAGMRSVAPARPAIEVSVNSCAWVNGKPRFSICTVMMPHISQTAKPFSRLGTEIHRLRFATRLPVVSQNALSSGRQSTMSTELVTCGAGAPALVADVMTILSSRIGAQSTSAMRARIARRQAENRRRAAPLPRKG